MTIDDLQKKILASLNYDPDRTLVAIEREDLKRMLEVLEEYELMSAKNEEEE